MAQEVHVGGAAVHALVLHQEVVEPWLQLVTLTHNCQLKTKNIQMWERKCTLTDSVFATTKTMVDIAVCPGNCWFAHPLFTCISLENTRFDCNKTNSNLIRCCQITFCFFYGLFSNLGIGKWALLQLSCKPEKTILLPFFPQGQLLWPWKWCDHRYLESSLTEVMQNFKDHA